MLIVIWVVRVEVNLRELGIFALTYIFGVLIWLLQQHNIFQTHVRVCGSQSIAAPLD